MKTFALAVFVMAILVSVIGVVTGMLFWFGADTRSENGSDCRDDRSSSA